MDVEQVSRAPAWTASGPAEEPVGPSIRARSRGESARSLLWEVAQTVILTVVIFFLVRAVIQNFRVEGASMVPTLQSGQYLLINKVLYARADGTPLDRVFADSTPNDDVNFVFGGPERGDIIVFHAPGQSDKDFIKRVIGLPGEMVRVNRGQVFVNGQRLDEPYIRHRATYDLEEQRVPPGSYFVLGDNRPNSSDSHLGWFLPADNIIGKAWVSYWPPTYWGVMPAAAYDDR